MFSAVLKVTGSSKNRSLHCCCYEFLRRGGVAIQCCHRLLFYCPLWICSSVEHPVQCKVGCVLGSFFAASFFPFLGRVKIRTSNIATYEVVDSCKICLLQLNLTLAYIFCCKLPFWWLVLTSHWHQHMKTLIIQLVSMSASQFHQTTGRSTVWLALLHFTENLWYHYFLQKKSYYKEYARLLVCPVSVK